jgi:N-acetylmuramate 1-kinase
MNPIEITTLVQQFILETFPNAQLATLVQLSGSGSNRNYFRFYENKKSIIVTYNDNVAENESFFYMTQHFSAKKIPVPTLFCIDKSRKIYAQNDLGATELLSFQLAKTDKTTKYYKKSIDALIAIQIEGDSGFDYSKCYDFDCFDAKVVLHDLYYFKNYFLDLLDINYSKKALLEEFDWLSQKIVHLPLQYFMFRDFQARNIMIFNDNPYLIDYQGGMKGPIQYDLVSLLWQAKANLTDAEKDDYYNYYFTQLQDKLSQKIDAKSFQEGYNLCLIIRSLQVLGAYGFRGLYEKKIHFIESIAFGLQNLETLLIKYIFQGFPELTKIIQQLISSATKQKINTLINGK